MFVLSRNKKLLLQPSIRQNVSSIVAPARQNGKLTGLMQHPPPPLYPQPNMPLFSQQRRLFSIWTVPKLLLSTTSKKNRYLIVGTIGAFSFLSSILGPVVWVAVGGAASLVSWRIFRKTRNWWDYLSSAVSSNQPSSSSSSIPSITQALLSQIGIHRGAEVVRMHAIKELKRFFENTKEGKKVLEEFGLDHEKNLVYDDVFKSEAVKLDTETSQHTVTVHFWLEDQTSKGPKGGSCEVIAAANVSGQGNVNLEEVRLSSPGWHSDEVVPISEAH